MDNTNGTRLVYYDTNTLNTPYTDGITQNTIGFAIIQREGSTNSEGSWWRSILAMTLGDVQPTKSNVWFRTMHNSGDTGWRRISNESIHQVLEAGNIELYSHNTPYIDFHYGWDASHPEDYTHRIIADTETRLRCSSDWSVGGKLLLNNADIFVQVIRGNGQILAHCIKNINFTSGTAHWVEADINNRFNGTVDQITCIAQLRQNSSIGDNLYVVRSWYTGSEIYVKLNQNVNQMLLVNVIIFGI